MALDCSFALTENIVFVCPDPAAAGWLPAVMMPTPLR